ncbi:MAG: VOC family protein [Myxococcota bacterium]|nr:VOC family protein [Myxococcota bacterium]
MVRHIAGLAEIVEDYEAAVAFYRDTLGLPVKEQGPGYAVVEAPGILHFGIWSRETAAESTFGDRSRAGEIALGFTLGIEVDRVDDAVGSLSASGRQLLQAAKDEPWGQRTARFAGPSGALFEFSETPWARRLAQAPAGAEES